MEYYIVEQHHGIYNFNCIEYRFSTLEPFRLWNSAPRNHQWWTTLMIWLQQCKMEMADSLLSNDLNSMWNFFIDWRLTPSLSKMVNTSFYLNNKLTNEAPKIYLNHNSLPYNSYAKYLGVTFHWALSYRIHLKNTEAKIILGTTYSRN